MQCIFNYCKPDLSRDLAVVAFYATAVLLALGLSYLAHSKSIRAAAWLIAGAWLASILAFFAWRLPGYYGVELLLKAMLAWRFRQMAQRQIFPATLCILTLAEGAFLALAIAAGVSTYAILFVTNRFFEASLLYLAGCALFRIHIRREQALKEKPIEDWRARFVVG